MSDFVDALAMGVTAWDSWKPSADHADAGKRTQARMEMRQIELRLSDMLQYNAIEVARLLVVMHRALQVEELLGRTESRLDHLDQRLEYLAERIDNAGMV